MLSRYICSQADGMKLRWMKEVSSLCCQSCNGTVVPGGTILEIRELTDKCGTVKTSLCKIKNRVGHTGTLKEILLKLSLIDKGNIHKAPVNLEAAKEAGYHEEFMPVAAIEDEYHYKKCCSDKNGYINANQLPGTIKIS